MSPSLLIETVMFSGLVLNIWLVSAGSLSLTVSVITGAVIRKMISKTSITSTNGVVLMVLLTSSSPSPSLPIAIPIMYLFQIALTFKTATSLSQQSKPVDDLLCDMLCASIVRGVWFKLTS